MARPNSPNSPQDPEELIEDREERMERYERLRHQIRPDGRRYTDADCARELGVSTKTIQRWRADLRAQGRLTKEEIPAAQYSQSVRDEIFERHVDTFDMIRKAILRTERAQALLDAELGFDGPPCECCGRAKLVGNAKEPDFLKWQTAFKGGDSINNQIVTLAKMLGQISDNQIVLVQQIDEDVMLIMEELAKLDKEVARRLFNTLIERSKRRRERLPEFTDIVDGEYKRVEGPKEE